MGALFPPNEGCALTLNHSIFTLLDTERRQDRESIDELAVRCRIYFLCHAKKKIRDRFSLTEVNSAMPPGPGDGIATTASYRRTDFLCSSTLILPPNEGEEPIQ